jgi:hypothetical protein
MSEQAKHAIIAAKNYKQWGSFAAYRYAVKKGVHPALIRLARQLQSVEGF